MKVICPDCGKEFFVSIKTLSMLSDSFKINPALKMICSTCGDKILRKYAK